MGSEWTETTLGELCESQRGSIQTGPFGSQLHASDYQDAGTPVVMPVNLVDGRVSEAGIARVGDAHVSSLARHKLLPGDIVFSRRGDVTRFALITERENGWLCGTGCLKVSLGEQELATAEFVAGVLSLPESKAWLVQHAVGATMPNLNTSILSALPVRLPDLATQRSATSLLTALTARMESLRQTNATLEAIAQALFKSWFVDFDPVRARAEGHEPDGLDAATAALFPDAIDTQDTALPHGWHWAKLGEIFEVGIGKTPPRKEVQWFSQSRDDVLWASIRDMGESGAFLMSTSERLTTEAVDRFNVRSVPAGTVMMSFKLTIGRVAIAGRDMTTNEAIAHFKSTPNSLPQTYLYCYLKSYNMDSISSTSSIATATNSKAIRDLAIPHPGDSLANAFHDAVAPIFDKIRVQQQRMRTLSELRGTLLPRLISGKLRLPEVERAGNA